MAENAVRPRRIRDSDLQVVSEYLKNELQTRKSSDWRLAKEKRWKEVDRQIELESMKRVQRDPNAPKDEKPVDWQSAIELGELAMASEMYSADAQRILFPMNRSWFEPHVKGPEQFDPQSGMAVPVLDAASQKILNGTMANMMAQQHLDFGLKARVGLSLKEAFHHGSFVATAEYDSMEQFYGDGIKKITAPVWKPHSMWNCYPDEAPSVISQNMYYQGTMFIESFMPWEKFKEISGKADGFWAKQLDKVESEESGSGRIKDVRIATYYGDVYIKRGDGDIYLPNQVARLYNDVLCYAKDSPTPWRPVIYLCYERMDVRNPYGTSPVVKMSPMQKLASTLANRFVDGIELSVEPPATYDRNDPELMAQGGPTLAPGEKIPTHNPQNVNVLKMGDPGVAQAGLMFFLQRMQVGLAISPYKQGIAAGDRLTAEEAQNIEQGAEVRPLHFIENMTDALRSFLYMQHAMNLRNASFEYEFYNSEMGAPDFQRVVRRDLPEKAHFDVVGARGVLGEARRAMMFTQTTALLSQNPLTMQLLEPMKIAIQMYEDAGVKHPEQFLKPGGPDPQVAAMMQQMQQLVQQLQQALTEAESGNYVELYKASHNFVSKMAGIQSKERIAQMQTVASSDTAAKDRMVSFETDQRALELEYQKLADGSYEGTVTKPDGSKRKVSVRRKPSGGYSGSSKTIQ